MASQFVTEEYAYFKSDKCRDLDRHLGDLHSFISGRSRRLDFGGEADC